MAFFSLTDIKFKSEGPRFFNKATNFEEGSLRETSFKILLPRLVMQTRSRVMLLNAWLPPSSSRLSA